jgi:hypothetical protein
MFICIEPYLFRLCQTLSSDSCRTIPATPEIFPNPTCSWSWHPIDITELKLCDHAKHRQLLATELRASHTAGRLTDLIELPRTEAQTLRRSFKLLLSPRLPTSSPPLPRQARAPAPHNRHDALSHAPPLRGPPHNHLRLHRPQALLTLSRRLPRLQRLLYTPTRSLLHRSLLPTLPTPLHRVPPLHLPRRRSENQTNHLPTRRPGPSAFVRKHIPQHSRHHRALAPNRHASRSIPVIHRNRGHQRTMAPRLHQPIGAIPIIGS